MDTNTARDLVTAIARLASAIADDAAETARGADDSFTGSEAHAAAEALKELLEKSL